MRVDFHLHTRFSDGGMEPEDLLFHVRKARIDHFAVTDHDTLAGYFALRGQPGLIPGVEVTAESAGSGEVHVVALGIDPEQRAFAGFLAHIRAVRRTRIERLIASLHESERLSAMSIAPQAEAVTRFHLAVALVHLGRADHVREAFETLIGDAQCAVMDLPPYPSVSDAASAIRAAGGVAILAHPGVYVTKEQIALHLDQGLDGLETAHPRLDPRLAEDMQGMASARGLLESCGSDTHVIGARRPGDPQLPDDRILPLVQRLIA
jgi:predicted metal-dependent phosphoesterase TrpH